MTLTLFISLVTILSLISSLVTEGLKHIIGDTKPTIIVAIVSAIVGWGGGAAIYILRNIAFDTSGIICLILLAPTLFLTATLGYDKVMEVIQQIKGTWE